MEIMRIKYNYEVLKHNNTILSRSDLYCYYRAVWYYYSFKYVILIFFIKCFICLAHLRKKITSSLTYRTLTVQYT